MLLFTSCKTHHPRLETQTWVVLLCADLTQLSQNLVNFPTYYDYIYTSVMEFLVTVAESHTQLTLPATTFWSGSHMSTILQGRKLMLRELE